MIDWTGLCAAVVVDDRVCAAVREQGSQAYYIHSAVPLPASCFWKDLRPGLACRAAARGGVTKVAGLVVLFFSTVSVDVSFPIVHHGVSACSRTKVLIFGSPGVAMANDGPRYSDYAPPTSNVCHQVFFDRSSHATHFLPSSLSSSTASFHRPVLRGPFHLNKDFRKRR